MSDSPYRIRPAADADGAAVRDLVFAVMNEFGLGLAPDGADADLYAIDDHYAARGGWLEIVLLDDAIVGTVGMVPQGDGVIELRKMYLRPDQRGAGLGKALLARSISRAGEAGYSKIVLETATVLEAAIGLYRRFGFVKVESAPGCGKSACDQVWRLELGAYRPPDNLPELFQE